MNKIYDILVSRNYLSIDTMQRVEEYSKKWQISPFKSILETNLLDETLLADCFAEDMGLNRVYHLDSAAIELDAVRKIPYSIAKKCELLPLMFLDEKKSLLEVAVSDPFCPTSLNFLDQELDCNYEIVLGERSDILKAIDQYYPLQMQLKSLQD